MLKMLSMWVLIIALGAFFPMGSAVSESDILDYLTAVGHAHMLHRTWTPAQCVNNAWRDWTLDDTSYVKQFVGIVCRRFPNYGGTPRSVIEIACLLFERIAVDFLARLWNSIRSEAKNSQRITSYTIFYNGRGKKLTYSKVRELFPTTCDKLIAGIRILRVPEDQATNASEMCKILIKDSVQYLALLRPYSNEFVVYRPHFPSQYRKNSSVTYELVKVFLPGICEGDEMVIDNWNWTDVRSSCDYLKNHAGRILSDYPRGGISLGLDDAKPFIVDICGKYGNWPQYKAPCEYLLKTNLNAFLNPVDT